MGWRTWTCGLCLLARGAALTASSSRAARKAWDAGAPRCPQNPEGQLLACRDAMVRGLEAGVTRQRVRTMLPRGEDRQLTALDETWTGGIMQLYGPCARFGRDLLRALAVAREDARPKRVSEQRLDASGVDGESLLVAESASTPAMDASCFVQPSVETLQPILATTAAAGPQRLVALLNPQFREVDDTLDFLASKAGFFGKLGTFLGGKGKFVEQLDQLGFQDVFSLQEIVVSGTTVRYFLAYPYKWQIYAISDRNDEPPIRLGEDTNRPDYNKVAKVLDANKIRPKIIRDTNENSIPLTQAAIKVLYHDESAPDSPPQQQQQQEEELQQDPVISQPV